VYCNSHEVGGDKGHLFVVGLERSSHVCENCNLLVHIPAATEDRPLSTMFVILEHRHFSLILLTFVKCPCNGFIVLSITLISSFLTTIIIILKGHVTAETSAPVRSLLQCGTLTNSAIRFWTLCPMGIHIYRIRTWSPTTLSVTTGRPTRRQSGGQLNCRGYLSCIQPHCLPSP